jgi:hypothetical protein
MDAFLGCESPSIRQREMAADRGVAKFERADLMNAWVAIILLAAPFLLLGSIVAYLIVTIGNGQTNRAK